ncbi:hypothetical protein MUP95_06320, partial [bacterium]|nr:hypothetical protein [bacterium]
GRIGELVHTAHCGVHYVKAYCANPTDPNTARQQQVRKIFGDLSKAYHDLSEDSHNLWNNYASLAHVRFTGKQAFIKLNGSLLGCSHADLITINYPPLTPSTPQFPIAFSAVALTSVSTCISWTSPLNDSVYISCYFHLHTGFCLEFPTYDLCNTVGYRPTQRFVETVRSDVGSIVHTHAWPVTAWLFYKAFSIDRFGRKSPLTHEIKVIVLP